MNGDFDHDLDHDPLLDNDEDEEELELELHHDEFDDLQQPTTTATCYQ